MIRGVLVHLPSNTSGVSSEVVTNLADSGADIFAGKAEYASGPLQIL